MRLFRYLFCSFGLLFMLAGSANAHFGMIIPSQPVVMGAKDSNIELELKFWHSFENIGMNLAKPTLFKVFHEGKSTDLLPSLIEIKEQGMTTWKSEYKITRPGIYTFIMEPAPYFEKEEDCFIIHYTKVYVDAYGNDQGWDKALGIKAEIVPMVKPGALYAGNLFQGQVLRNGKPVPHAEVEVEWYPGKNFKGVAPYQSMITQTIKADAFGVFSYVAPRQGWWGFAALMTADEKMQYQGEEKDIEIGAVLWVQFHELLATIKLQ